LPLEVKLKSADFDLSSAGIDGIERDDAGGCVNDCDNRCKRSWNSTIPSGALYVDKKVFRR